MTPYKYVIRQLLRNFLGSYLLFSCIFMINFVAMHLEMAEKNRFLLIELIEHVGRITLAHSYVLAPLALLMSSCLTYTFLSLRLEITAFLTQGVSKFKLLKPLLDISIALMILEGIFYHFYDGKNEKMIETSSVVGSNKTNNHPVQILDLENGQKIVFSTEGQKEAYFYTDDNKLYFSTGFNPKNRAFLACQEVLFEGEKLALVDLNSPITFKIKTIKKIQQDASKAFQIALILSIPFLIWKEAFRFERTIRPLKILGRTSIIYLGSHILVKSLCHILSKLI